MLRIIRGLYCRTISPGLMGFNRQQEIYKAENIAPSIILTKDPQNHNKYETVLATDADKACDKILHPFTINSENKHGGESPQCNKAHLQKTYS